MFSRPSLILPCGGWRYKVQPHTCWNVGATGKNKQAEYLEHAQNKAANFIWQKVMMGSASVIPLEAKHHKIVSGGDVCRTAAPSCVVEPYLNWDTSIIVLSDEELRLSLTVVSVKNRQKAERDSSDPQSWYMTRLCPPVKPPLKWCIRGLWCNKGLKRIRAKNE